jgi:hypothetical protein
LPDVSLFSGSGTWRHAYVYCFSDSTYKKEDDPKPCTGSPYNWSIAGGTSFATPILAGIQALVNQKNGAYQGNPNYVYYRLAAAEYGVIGSSSCNSTLGNAASSSCIFYDLTLGDTDVPCTGSSDCYNAGGEYGILSTSDYAPERVFEAAIGWDFATGIGSVNALNLVMNWNSGKNPYSPPSVTPIYEFPAASQGLIGPRGSEPLGGLTLGKGGVLYGSTCLGGSIGGGTIFSLTPPKSATGTWSQSVLYSFSGETDAGCPSGTLAIDANGVLYGTALGNGGLGFVYSLTPPVEGGAPWTEITLYAFAGELDGGEPQGGLLIYNGALFGTTSLGGSAGNNGSGWGTVFELSPPPSGSGSWIEAVIYRFGGAPDGAIPNGQLTIDAGGVLYGTTVEGGEGLGDGTVFSLSPPLPRSNSWTENILYSFQDSPDGAQPSGGLEFIGQNLVGVTGGGGSLTCNRGVGCGIVYELFPPKVAGLPWTEANLYSFGGGFDGDSPSGNLVFDNAGNLYGATMFGGTASGLGYGTLYELSSPTQSGAPWGYVRLYNFLGGPDGCYINGNLILGGKGVLYGTAESCGTGIIDDGNGTVFEAQY